MMAGKERLIYGKFGPIGSHTYGFPPPNAGNGRMYYNTIVQVLAFLKPLLHHVALTRRPHCQCLWRVEEQQENAEELGVASGAGSV